MKNAPCRLEDCKTYALKGIDTWKVQGHSGAGERTGYFVHGPQLVVDCGLSTWKTPSAVLLTHRHTDHSAELPQIISSHTPPRKGQEGLSGRPVVMPHECVPMIAHFCASIAWLSDGVCPASPEEALKRICVHPIPAKHGDSFTIPGVPNVKIEVIAAHHAETSSNGYGIIELKTKLRPEFQDLKGTEIAELRKSGTDVSMVVETPRLLIYGDTTPDALLLHDEWQKYPNIFIECTACEWETDEKKAAAGIASRRERGHTHINELLPILEKYNEGRRWFIHHTSLATNPDHIRTTLTASKLTDWTLVTDN